MREPVNPLPGARRRATSSAVAVTVDVFDSQPLVSPPDDSTSTPDAQLQLTTGTFTDDATRLITRTMRLETDSAPDWLRPGMWIRVSVGIQVMQPIVYRLPAMVIEDIGSPLDRNGGVSIEASDASAVVEGRPYEKDTSLAPNDLQSLVQTSFDLALSRGAHTGGVPVVALAAGAIAEFGAGRWSVCVRQADALGYALHLNDYGDPVAVSRSAAAPAPVSTVEQSLLPGGVRHSLRVPTAARVFVTRGSNLAPLIGKATTVEPVPAWYRPMVVTDRQEGPEWWNQGYADSAAEDFLNRALTEYDRYDSLPILSSPWLEAGFDTVSFYGRTYWVSAVTMQFPSMAMTASLRRTVP